MNITPVYELRTQLRTAAIAGTSLLSENFRLKKAAENFSAIASASPVFTKINEQIKILLNENTPQALLDTITLTDSVITVLASVGTAAEITPVNRTENRTVIINAPYSRLSALISALTTSGSGNFRIVKDVWENDKEIFRDYRVMPALISALGASYGELADLAADIIIEIGGESIIPVLKKDFDPKGKKDMARRVEVIEKLMGAKENDFYLEQLENSEKDVKNELILALSHDESNTERLAELVKTEKAAGRKYALYVLTTFDNEKAAQCLTEHSKKKPAEVLEVMQHASSKWTSNLTADILKRVLTDENGNIIKISELRNIAKSPLYPHDIANALCFKTGTAIEDIYRSYGDIKCTGFLASSLEKSICVTMDSGLISLAEELNKTKEYKGLCDAAETAAHILGDEDCTAWVKKNLDQSINFMCNISFENGSFVYSRSCDYNEFTGRNTIIRREVHQPLKEKITDILIKEDRNRTVAVLENWIDPDDPEYCLKLGKYFTKCFENGSYRYLTHMRKCGIKNVKGIVVRRYSGASFKKFPKIDLYDLKMIFEMLPGDPDYKLDEARSLVDAVKSGKLKLQIDAESFTQWAENEMNKE